MILEVSQIRKFLGDRELFLDASFRLKRGEKTILMGINGSGKSTLLRLITGEMLADSGTIKCHGTIGYMNQRLENFSATVYQTVLEAFSWLRDMESELLTLHETMARPEVFNDPVRLEKIMNRAAELQTRFELYGGSRIEAVTRSVLAGVGFQSADYEREPQTLSGGQKSRLALAKLVALSPDLMLLDEPTNHLDIENIKWLENFLKRYDKATLIVSHDRYLIESLAQKIVEVDSGRIFEYRGSYRHYLEQRELVHKTVARENQAIADKIQKEQEYIRRQHSWGNYTQAKSREKQLDRFLENNQTMEIGESREFSARFTPEYLPSAKTVLQVDRISKSYHGKTVLQELSLEVENGDRLGIIGPNGSGKSTLLKIIAGHETADQGTFHFGNLVRVSYFSQEHHELQRPLTLIQQLNEIRASATIQQIRSLLGKYQFRGEEHLKTVGVLSGGELSRLSFACLEMDCGNFLIMDEPTNHLDIEGVDAIIDALRAFPGTVVAVSHDRYFLEQVCNKLLLMNDGGLELFRGNYAEYHASLKAATKAELPAEQPPVTTQQSKPKKVDRYKVDKIEATIETLEQQRGTLEESIIANAADYARVMTLTSELEKVKQELEKSYRVWEELHDGG
ncbi:ABC-F family ATP-binding cassette domain-containing protein [Chrysiogenes arsenatis]|uniref:ABC-F family ATP-binding cassette domain-containing protein n=1 Tax=Chrysiogenes arsenatis TaxID=309797 RepID=UPI000424E8A3|nr:ABC-F family ATP-binding cassette domain-containing protein [Chrysiogenes arsenatis]